MSNAVDALNAAFKADPNAIHALICNRVPCNQELADDPFVVVDRSPVLSGFHIQVGAFGLVNGVLAANGLPLVATAWDVENKDEEGRAKLIGFRDFHPADGTAPAPEASEPEASHPDSQWKANLLDMYEAAEKSKVDEMSDENVDYQAGVQDALRTLWKRMTGESLVPSDQDA